MAQLFPSFLCVCRAIEPLPFLPLLLEYDCYLLSDLRSASTARSRTFRNAASILFHFLLLLLLELTCGHNVCHSTEQDSSSLHPKTSQPRTCGLPIIAGQRLKHVSLLNECRLPHLLELNLGWGWTFEMYQYAQRFLEAHPTIENLMWSCAYNVVLRQGSLPNLKHLSLSHLSFVCVLSAARGPPPPPPSPSPDLASEGTGTYAPPQPQPNGKLTLKMLGDLFLFSTTSRRRCRTSTGRPSSGS